MSLERVLPSLAVVQQGRKALVRELMLRGQNAELGEEGEPLLANMASFCLCTGLLYHERFVPKQVCARK